MKNLSREAVNELRYHARSVIRELGLLNDAFFEIGVTLAERHLLIELTQYPSPTMGEIAERLLLDKSTISRLISKSVKKNYIKCVTDEKDKRKRFLQMTEKGKETLNAVEPIAFNQTKEALSTLTPEEIDTVYRGVALYAKGLKNARIQNKATPLVSETEKGKEIAGLPEITQRLGQMGYSLDLYNEKDEEALYQIFQEVVDSGSQFPSECSSREEFHRQFFTPKGHVYVCSSSSGKAVGGFYLRANSSGRSSHIANAGYMIKSTYQGKGLGTLLVKASLHLAKDLGFQAMQFNNVLSQNTPAVKLYKRLGFSVAGTIPEAIRNPSGTFQDTYVMHRQLTDL